MYSTAAASLIGGRKENQDIYRITETQYGLLAVVCDGMGGAAGGKEAAEMAVNTITEEVLTSLGKDTRKAVTDAVSSANRSIYYESIKNPWLSGMGTTVAALLVNDTSALCFHVGDSRIYHLRNDKILYRTFDHSKVFEMVSMGLLTEEEARVSPDANIITRVVGTGPQIEVMVSPELLYQSGDKFLLCTDGIWGAVTEVQLVQIAAREKPVDEIITHLTEYINELGLIEGGNHDNLTAVLIEMMTD